MQRLKQNLMRAVAVAILPALAACSSDITLSNVNLLPGANVFKPDWLTFSGSKQDFTLREATAEDLVGADGQCAATLAAAPAGPADADGVEVPAGRQSPTVEGGIALQMVECEVVRRGGVPDKVEFGTNERNERAVVMIYNRGSRPGIYRFAGGRLVSIERGAEAPAPAKQKRQAPAKKAART
jgi:hypothetical protein